MKTPTRTRALTAAAVVVVGLGITACTPAQQAAFHEHVANKVATVQLAGLSQPNAPSDTTLARLRNCESHGNYGAVSASGTYRGAYQFSRATWNSTAARFLPEYRGHDPATAPSFVQDAMARALWSATGWTSWPVCGRRAL
jgi:hypothetical protein